MGLLDFFTNGSAAGSYLGNLIDPKTAEQFQAARAEQALLGLGSGLLALGPSRLPVTLGMSIGKGAEGVMNSQSQFTGDTLHAVQAANALAESKLHGSQARASDQTTSVLELIAKRAMEDEAAGRAGAATSIAKPTTGSTDPTAAPMSPVGSLDDPRGVIPIIRASAIKYGHDPDMAVRVASKEGLFDYKGDGGTSFGAFQLHVGGGMGDEFVRDTGLDPSDPKNEAAMIDYSMKHLDRTGWQPYHGAANAKIGDRAGISVFEPGGAPAPVSGPSTPGTAAGPVDGLLPTAQARALPSAPVADVVGGRPSGEVLQQVQAIPPDQLRGAHVVLSPGISNDRGSGDYRAFQQQLDYLTSNGAKVTVVGVGSKFGKQVPALQQITQAAGATYIQAGPNDGVHMSKAGYDGVLQGAIAANGQPTHIVGDSLGVGVNSAYARARPTPPAAAPSAGGSLPPGSMDMGAGYGDTPPAPTPAGPIAGPALVGAPGLSGDSTAPAPPGATPSAPYRTVPATVPSSGANALAGVPTPDQIRRAQTNVQLYGIAKLTPNPVDVEIAKYPMTLALEAEKARLKGDQDIRTAYPVKRGQEDAEADVARRKAAEKGVGEAPFQPPQEYAIRGPDGNNYKVKMRPDQYNQFLADNNLDAAGRPKSAAAGPAGVAGAPGAPSAAPGAPTPVPGPSGAPPAGVTGAPAAGAPSGVPLPIGERIYTPDEQSFGQTFTKDNAERFLKRRDAALDAQMSIEASKDAHKLLNSGMITGAGGDYRLAFGKALYQMGVTNSDDAISNTEAYVAARAGETARIIKNFGAGTGLSDSDKAYSQDAAAGRINLDEKSIRKILELNEIVSRRVIDKYNADADKVDPKLSPYPLRVEPPPKHPNMPMDADTKAGALDAISRGVPRGAVMGRLYDNGFNPAGL